MSGDQATTLAELRSLVSVFVDERDWSQFHSPKNLAMAIAIEAAELMDLFKWVDQDASSGLMSEVETKTAASEELADIVIYAIAFANRNSIDLSGAIKQKIEKNRSKYPVDKFQGNF